MSYSSRSKLEDFVIPLVDEAVVAPLDPSDILDLGTLNTVPCLAGEVSVQQAARAGWRAIGIRELFGRLDEDAYGVAG